MTHDIEIQCVPPRSLSRNPSTSKIGTVRCWSAPSVDDEIECDGVLYTVKSRSWVSPYVRDDGGAVIGIDCEADLRLVLTCTRVGT